MTTPPSGTFPPMYGQQLIPGWEQRVARGGGGRGGDGGGTFGDAFDFSFDRYATPAVIKVVYPILVVIAILHYVLLVLYAFGVGFVMALGLPLLFPVGPFLGIVTLLFGWIPGFFMVLSVRLGFERALAAVRTATDVRALRATYVGPAFE